MSHEDNNNNWTSIRMFADEQQHVQKYIFEKNDIAIEAVLYKYPTYQERTVLCISTMCGCPIGCTFCGTGRQFVRSLTTAEIIGQVTHILSNCIDGVDPQSIGKLQIMVMSMGEPMLVKNLPDAFRVLYVLYPNAQLLISTSAPDVNYNTIRELSVEIPNIGLQFSVHESTDEARGALIPFKKKLSLSQIAAEGEAWYTATGRKPYFNYCAHSNNSSIDDAKRLYQLFDPAIWEATVSVICEHTVGVQADQDNKHLAIEFGNTLLECGYNVRVFDPAGQDTIGGGCGQLWYVQEWMKEHPAYVHHIRKES
jgi:23S rRNA (adenine2503-C2)-methyltransferase